MAYVSKEKKAKIAEALKSVVPSGWKYSVAVENHSTIVMTIYAAPVDLLGKMPEIKTRNNYAENINHWLGLVSDCEEKQIIKSIIDILNTDNFDDSDIQTDYIHVGHYVNLQIGKWNRPFVVTGSQKIAA